MMLRTMPVTTVQPQLQPIKPIQGLGGYSKPKVRQSYCNTLDSSPDINNVIGQDMNVLLPTGRSVRLDEIDLNEGSQQFFLGSFNITQYLSPDQKKYFPGWDIEKENLRLYVQDFTDQDKAIVASGSDSAWELFVDYSVDDTVTAIAKAKVLAGKAAEVLQSAAMATPSAIASIGKFVLIGGAIYLLIEAVGLAKAFKK